MSDPALVLGALAVGTAFKLGALSWLGANRKRKFVRVGTVSQLNVFPVKSCAAIAVETAECTETGLCHNGATDRHWMAVDQNGGFISQRKEPSMALIQTRLVNKEIELSAPGLGSIRLPIAGKPGQETTSKGRVWGDFVVEAVDCGDRAGALISRHLNKPGCRILRYRSGLTVRGLKKHTWKTYSKPEDTTAFNENSSYMILSEASLGDLNTRLARKVTISNFRPNIVVTGVPPYAEDKWMEIRIGENAVLRYIDACSRCIFTTVDPETGVKSEDQEPLKTLRSYRLHPQYGKAPLFGTHWMMEESGEIQVGDPVYALPWPQGK